MPVDAATEIISLYERHARTWLNLRLRGTFYEREWLGRFAAALPSSASILDIGCGGGHPVASYFIGLGHSITGIDSSATMIAISRERHSAHTWIKEDMRTLDLRQRFDGLLAWDSFFHLTADDQRKMFSVFARHSAPSAVLMFTSGPRYGEALGTFEGEALYHASLAPDEYRGLLSENGFSVQAFVPEDPGCAGRTVWLCRAKGNGPVLGGE
ncbi:MAG: class I SAM-dependent methyltransferase [Alphaproteobacteria bacterium]